MIIARKKALQLDGKSLTLDFALPPSAATALQALVAAVQEKVSLDLVLTGLSATPAGIARGVEYRIYLNLPNASDDKLPHQEFYIASINTFALSDPKHQGHGQTLRFSLGRLAQGLAKIRRWTSDQISLSFVSDDAEGGEPMLTINEIELELTEK